MPGCRPSGDRARRGCTEVAGLHGSDDANELCLGRWVAGCDDRSPRLASVPCRRTLRTASLITGRDVLAITPLARLGSSGVGTTGTPLGASMGQQPHEIVATLATAGYAARCTHVVADLGIADLIGDQAVPTVELAASCAVDADALDRVLRLLAAHGVFERRDDGYAHTPASRLLRTDHPMSMRFYARMMGLPLAWGSLTELAHSLRTGSPGLDIVEPKGLWAYLQSRPADAAIFGRAMTAKAGADIGAVLAAYDFRETKTIADIGGGRGHLLRAVLEATPNAEGILFDLPHVIGSVDIVDQHFTAQAGDFFVDELPAAELYVLMHVLHDWDDDRCAAILGAVRDAADVRSTLLVIENVLTDGRAELRVTTADIVMLTAIGGRERTAAEFSSLFDRSGFSMTRIVETRTTMRIIEAKAV